MNIGKEPWKWGLVFMLLAVFVVVANQAYVAVSSYEEVPPPDDWKSGDSFDQEHQAGPGAGIPMSVPEDLPTDFLGGDPGGGNDVHDADAVDDFSAMPEEPVDWHTVPNPGSVE